MCGIAGVFGLQEKLRLEEHTLEKMIAKLSHRGPDGQSIYIDEQGWSCPRKA